jgi:cyclase
MTLVATLDPSLQELGQGCHAWVQPDGGWGLSNAGLVVGQDSSLLVDTLFDLRLTRRMLDRMAYLTGSAPVRTVVNTHGNGDHWFGNQLLPQAEVIASDAAAAEMRQVGPAQVRELLAMPEPAGSFAQSIFGGFHFEEVEPRYPTRTFTGELRLDIGGTEVRLLEVGPAHTAGDVVVHVPAARTVFVGDIVFNGGTPIVWGGPVASWLAACDRLLALNVDIVVPGHGPVAGPECLATARDYLERVYAAASAAYSSGLSATAAAREIAADDPAVFATPPEAERLAVNVHAVYRELDPTHPALAGPQLFGCMAELLEARR